MKVEDLWHAEVLFCFYLYEKCVNLFYAALAKSVGNSIFIKASETFREIYENNKDIVRTYQC